MAFTKLTAALLATLLSASLCHARGVRHYIVTSPLAAADTTITDLPDSPDNLRLIADARCRLSADNAITIGVSSQGATAYEFTLRRVVNTIDDLGGDRAIAVTACRIDGDSTMTIAQAQADRHVNLRGGVNTVIVDTDLAAQRISLLVGDHEPRQLLSLSIGTELSGDAALYLRLEGKSELTHFSTEREPDLRAPLLTDCQPEMLARGIGLGNHPAAGVWEYLDRENDRSYAMPGGNYRLATVYDADRKTLDIVYLGGAEVADDLWTPGMKKGELRPTIFVGNYDLSWHDAHMQPLRGDMHAGLSDDGALLTFSFPELKARLRFRRVLTDR